MRIFAEYADDGVLRSYEHQVVRPDGKPLSAWIDTNQQPREMVIDDTTGAIRLGDGISDWAWVRQPWRWEQRERGALRWHTVAER